MSTLKLNVDVEEMADSPQESYNENGFSASVQLLCPWRNRFDVMQYVLAGASELYPHAPLTLARARTASSAPFQARVGQLNGSGGELAYYDKAVVTINYVFDSQTESGGELFSESLEPTTEFLTIDPSRLKWSNGDKLKHEEAPGRLYRGLNYVLTRHNQRAIPPSVMYLPGCVNGGPFTAMLLGVTFAPETLLYQPPACQRSVSRDGTAGWTITYRLSYRYPGWNEFWNSATGKWDTIRNPNNSKYYVYPLGNFNGI